MVRFVVAMASSLASPRAWGSSEVRAVCWVGGIAELPDFAGASADEARAPAGGPAGRLRLTLPWRAAWPRSCSLSARVRGTLGGGGSAKGLDASGTRRAESPVSQSGLATRGGAHGIQRPGGSQPGQQRGGPASAGRVHGAYHPGSARLHGASPGRQRRELQPVSLLGSPLFSTRINSWD